MLARLSLCFMLAAFAPQAQETSPTKPPANDRTLARIQKLDNQISGVQNQINALQTQLAPLQKQQAELEREEADIRRKHLAGLTAADHTLLQLTRLSRQPLGALVLGDLLDVQYRREKVLGAARHELLHTLTTNRNALEMVAHKRTEIAGTLASLSTISSDLSARQENLFDLRAKHLAALQVNDQKLARQLQASLEPVQIGKIKTMPRLSATTAAVQGLPVRGQIARKFNEADENGLHASGLTVVGVPGESVRTQLPGRVLFAGPFRSFGLLVIVDHGDINGRPLQTLYGGLASTPHTVGTAVAAGQTLGSLPKNPKPQLYFEKRVGGVPVNPL